MIDLNLKNPIFKQIVLFVLVGGVCYFVSILLLLFFVEITAMEVNLANLIASFITIFICYILNASFVFKSGRHSRSKEILSFFTFSLFGLLLNVILMYLMTTYLPIWYVISKTIITGLVAVFNFVVRKKIVFLQ